MEIMVQNKQIINKYDEEVRIHITIVRNSSGRESPLNHN